MGSDFTSAETATDPVGRLSQISSRTNLLAIEALVRAIPRGETGWADAALEASVVARRMARATEDFRASIPEVTPA